MRKKGQNENIKKDKGITLVALVVTIVVLIILAVISINVIFGEKGIIAEAQKSREKQEIAEYMDKFNVAEATTGAKNEGEVTLDLFIKEVISEGIIEEACIEKNEEENYYTLTSDEGYVFEVILKKENDVEVTYKLKGENIPKVPEIQINNIKITTDGSNEAMDRKIGKGTPLFISFEASIEGGTTEITPTVPYKTDGEEIEVTFTIVGKVGAKEYQTTKTVNIENKYIKIDAAMVKSEAKEFYGKTITGYTCNKNYNWQILYSDGTNIYITTTDYIKVGDCPTGAKNTSVTANGTYKLAFNNIINDYDGSEDITDSRIKKLLIYLSSEYGINNKNENMKATAYLLDISRWTNFKGENAEYAIGAPTLDLFFASYKDTHPNKYLELRIEQYGYSTKWSDSATYNNDITGLSTNEFNGLYVANSSLANCQRFASTSANYGSGGMPDAGYQGTGIGANYYNNAGYAGLRPVVCLSPDVQLEKINQNGTISYKIK